MNEELLLRIESKIKVLVDKVIRLEAENAEWKSRYEALQEEIAGQKYLLDAQEVTDKNDPMPQAAYERELKPRLKLNKELDQYIRELDKCIDWLQQM